MGRPKKKPEERGLQGWEGGLTDEGISPVYF